MVPKDLLYFNTKELDMMIAGVPFIDLEDWEANTTYQGAYSPDHKVIRWFWKELYSYDQQQLRKILHFATGSTRTPIEGFRY